MKKKQKNNILLLLACIIGYASVVLSITMALFLGFNILGVGDIYKDLLLSFSANIDVDGQMGMYIIELGLGALMNLYFAGYYRKGLKYRVENKQYGKMLITQGIFQVLIASVLSGVFAIIAGLVMSKKKEKSAQVQLEEMNAYLSDFKMAAMSDAVRKLKELKERGAISEEEYYASLNKILES
jgi:hypothetical protein